MANTRYTIRLLHFMALVDLLAVGLILPLIPLHVRKMGGSHIAIGALGSVYAIFQLFSGPVIGCLSDLKGRRPILVTCLLVCAVAYAVIGHTSSVTVILLMRAILGIFKHTQLLTRASVPDCESNQNKHSAIYGKMAAISGIGFTLGPMIGGHIADDYPEKGLMYISYAVCCCFVLNAGLASILIPTKVKSVRKKAVSQNMLTAIKCSLKEAQEQLISLDWSKYWDVFLLKALIGFAMSVYFSHYSLFLDSTFGLSKKYIGYIVSFQGTIGSFSSYFIGSINKCYSGDDDYSVRIFHIFVLLSCSLAGLIVSNNIYCFIFWLVPLSVGNAIGRLISLEMILKRSGNDHTGTLIGASNSVRSLTGVIAPVSSGFVVHHFGICYFIYLSILSTLIGLGMSFYGMSNKMKIA